MDGPSDTNKDAQIHLREDTWVNQKKTLTQNSKISVSQNAIKRFTAKPID